MESLKGLCKMFKPSNDDTSAEPKSRPAIMKKLHAQRQVERRQQRDKLIFENRIKTLTTSNLKLKKKSASPESTFKVDQISNISFSINGPKKILDEWRSIKKEKIKRKASKIPIKDASSLLETENLFEKVDLDKRDVKYYRYLVDINTFYLNQIRSDWNMLCLNEAIPEDIKGDIRSACGLAKLLIDERFFQFNDLINQCEQSILKCSEIGLVVKCSDLQGYWDTVDVQVKDVAKKFEILEKIKLNNYVKPLEMIESRPAVESKQTKSNFITNKNYLRKKNQKQENAESGGQVETNNQIVEKPTSKPNFSELRAKMKAMKQQSIQKEKNQEIVIQVSELKPKTPKVVDFEKENKDSPRKSTRPRSIKPILPSTNQFETKKYKSRPSDLIKFDSPDVLKTNQLENNPEIIYKEQMKEKDEFFTFDDNTELWKSRPSLPPQNQNNFTSKTSAKLSISRDSLDMPKFTNVINSPLLKIALISTKSKRLSINTLNRLFD